MPARLNAQRFFLTYSQVTDWEFTENSLADFLSSLPHFHWCEVAEEEHQDGGYHFHAVVVFQRRFQRGMHAFDLNGFHPNIEVIKNATTDLYRVRHYIRKGDRPNHSVSSHEEEPCTFTAVPVGRGEVPDYVAPTKRIDWGDILDTATDAETFLQLVRTNKPADYVLQFDNIKAFAQHHFDHPSEYVSPYEQESFITTPELDDWVQNVLRQVCSHFTTGSLRAEPSAGERAPPIRGVLVI